LPVEWQRFAARADHYMRNLSVSLRKRPADSGSDLRSSAATVAAGQPEQRRWELSRHSQPAGKPAETVLLLPRRPVRATSLPMANGLIGLGQGCDDLLSGRCLGARRCNPLTRRTGSGPPDRRWQNFGRSNRRAQVGPPSLRRIGRFFRCREGVSIDAKTVGASVPADRATAPPVPPRAVAADETGVGNLFRFV
jgi:hypothetical protein